MPLGPSSVSLQTGHHNMGDLEDMLGFQPIPRWGGGSEPQSQRLPGIKKSVYHFNREAEGYALEVLGGQACTTALGLAVMKPETLRCNFNGLP